MNSNIRDEWRITDIERKVNNVNDRMYELDNLRSTVDNLKNSIRELIEEARCIRSDFEYYKVQTDDRLYALEFSEDD